LSIDEEAPTVADEAPRAGENGKNGDHLLYAATHGRGAWRLRLN
jgi:hypothetical protein